MSKKEQPTIGNGLVSLLGTQAVDVPKSEPAIEDEDKFSTELVVKTKAQEIDRVRESLAQFKEPETDPKAIIAAQLEAQKTLDSARKLAKEAESTLRKCQEEFNAIDARAKALDTLTETERNKQYLDSQLKIRLDAAAEQRARYEALTKAGLLSTDEVQKLAPPMTPLDRAIGERNQKMKQAQNSLPALRRP
jgi:hypothetical protein